MGVAADVRLQLRVVLLPDLVTNNVLDDLHKVLQTLLTDTLLLKRAPDVLVVEALGERLVREPVLNEEEHVRHIRHLGRRVALQRECVSLKKNICAVLTPHIRRLDRVLVGNDLVIHAVVHPHRGRRRQRLLQAHHKRVQDLVHLRLAKNMRAAMHKVFANDLGEGVAQQRVRSAMSPHKLHRTATLGRQTRAQPLKQVIIRIRNTSDTRNGERREQTAIQIDQRTSQVRWRAAHRKALCVHRRRIRRVQRSSPARGNGTARVARGNHRRVLLQVQLVVVQRRLDTIKRLAALKGTKAKRAVHSLVVRECRDVAGLKDLLRKQQLIVLGTVAGEVTSLADRIAQRTLGAIGIHVRQVRNQLVPLSIVRNQHRRSRHGRVRLVRTSGTVQDLVRMLHLDLVERRKRRRDLARTKHRTRLFVLPARRSMVERIVLGRKDVRAGLKRSDCGAGHETSAQREENEQERAHNVVVGRCSQSG